MLSRESPPGVLGGLETKRQKSRSPSALASHLSGFSSVLEENGDFFAMNSHEHLGVSGVSIVVDLMI